MTIIMILNVICLHAKQLVGHTSIKSALILYHVADMFSTYCSAADELMYFNEIHLND